MNARQKAITAGALEFFAQDINKVDEKLQNVTSDIEKNNLKSAEKKRVSLQDSYLNLELRAIKKGNLGRAQTTISQAIKEGAGKFAPQSLAIAEKNYKDTDLYITGNRYDVDQIKSRSQIVNESADHLLKITQESKKTKIISPEELALQMESKEKQIVENQKDLIVKQDVAESLSAENRNLEKTIVEKQKDLADKQSAAEALSAENIALESEKKFNEKFEKARHEFTEKEAEVYKQGDSLTIRLRGLGFPRSKAALSNSNFPLLAKVQKVINEFGSSSVIVEGHADSSGGKAINTKVAQERAQTVKEYFVSNGIIPEEKIKAIGYSDEKPLATNKTAAGRAQNRRVDVVIMIDKNKKL